MAYVPYPAAPWPGILWNMGVGYVAVLVLWQAYQRGWLKT
jgi:hypothetical protein